MKNLIVCGVSAVKWKKRVRISDELSIFFHPSLEDVCKQRDCFWRLMMHSLSLDHSPSYWWKMATEAEAVIENLAGDYSI